MDNLSKVIENIERLKGIEKCYLHRNWGNGKLELNIEFNNSIADEILEESNIEEIDYSAFWE